MSRSRDEVRQYFEDWRPHLASSEGAQDMVRFILGLGVALPPDTGTEVTRKLPSDNATAEGLLRPAGNGTAMLSALTSMPCGGTGSFLQRASSSGGTKPRMPPKLSILSMAFWPILGRGPTHYSFVPTIFGLVTMDLAAKNFTGLVVEAGGLQKVRPFLERST